MKSSVEMFWDAFRAKSGDSRTWNQLHPMEQHKVIKGINLILSVVQWNSGGEDA